MPNASVHKGVEAGIPYYAVEICAAVGLSPAVHICRAAVVIRWLPEHMPAAYRAHREWSPSRFLRWAADIAPAVHQVGEHLVTHKPHPESSYRSCLGVLPPAWL